jgi:hypothetical protein
VQAYIAAMPGWKRDLGKRLDALIERQVHGVQKAVRWNSPFYGVEGQGFFLGIHLAGWRDRARRRLCGVRKICPGCPCRGSSFVVFLNGLLARFVKS